MKTFLKILGALLVLFICYIAYSLAFPVSPKATVSFEGENSTFEVVYSRPYKNGRLIFGSENDDALVPFDKYWRTGANSATTFETSSDIVFNGEKLKAGKYRLYTVPGENKWEVILNSEGDKYFAIMEPDTSKDVLSTSLSSLVSTKEIEQFTIDFVKDSTAVNLQLMWDKTMVSIPLK